MQLISFQISELNPFGILKWNLSICCCLFSYRYTSMTSYCVSVTEQTTAKCRLSIGFMQRVQKIEILNRPSIQLFEMCGSSGLLKFFKLINFPEVGLSIFAPLKVACAQKWQDFWVDLREVHYLLHWWYKFSRILPTTSPRKSHWTLFRLEG